MYGASAAVAVETERMQIRFIHTPLARACPGAVFYDLQRAHESGCGSLQSGTDGRHGFIRTCCHDCRRHCCFLPPRVCVCVYFCVRCAIEVACVAAGDGAGDLHLYFNFFVFIIINWVRGPLTTVYNNNNNMIAFIYYYIVL